MRSIVALVTGASRRVGAEIARQLHGAGALVMLHCRSSRHEADVLAAELNGMRCNSAFVIQGNIGDPGVPSALVEATIATFGQLDVLVNNASSFAPSPLATIDESAWNSIVGSNFKGPLFLCQAAAPHLIAGRGCIVNITDIHAERPLRGHLLYCAAKAGLLGLTRSLAVELAPEVRVNAVAPGAIAWPETGSVFSSVERNAIVADTLLKRVGEPADIARAVRFLVFDAPYVTGQVINVDGGRTAHL
jgi:pteridine reductase